MCLLICSFLNLPHAPINLNPWQLQLFTGSCGTHSEPWKKSYKELHLVNLFLAVNSDIIFLPRHLNLTERKRCLHVREENNVMDKRKKTHVGEYNGKAQAKSRINPANISKQSECKTQLWWAAKRGLLGINSSIFVGVYKAPVAHSHFCHENCMVTNPTFFSPSCFLNYYALSVYSVTFETHWFRPLTFLISWSIDVRNISTVIPYSPAPVFHQNAVNESPNISSHSQWSIPAQPPPCCFNFFC